MSRLSILWTKFDTKDSEMVEMSSELVPGFGMRSVLPFVVTLLGVPSPRSVHEKESQNLSIGPRLAACLYQGAVNAFLVSFNRISTG